MPRKVTWLPKLHPSYGGGTGGFAPPVPVETPLQREPPQEKERGKAASPLSLNPQWTLGRTGSDIVTSLSWALWPEVPVAAKTHALFIVVLVFGLLLNRAIPHADVDVAAWHGKGAITRGTKQSQHSMSQVRLRLGQCITALKFPIMPGKPPPPKVQGPLPDPRASATKVYWEQFHPKAI